MIMDDNGYIYNWISLLKPIKHIQANIKPSSPQNLLARLPSPMTSPSVPQFWGLCTPMDSSQPTNGISMMWILPCTLEPWSSRHQRGSFSKIRRKPLWNRWLSGRCACFSTLFQDSKIDMCHVVVWLGWCEDIESQKRSQWSNQTTYDHLFARQHRPFKHNVSIHLRPSFIHPWMNHDVKWLILMNLWSSLQVKWWSATQVVPGTTQPSGSFWWQCLTLSIIYSPSSIIIHHQDPSVNQVNHHQDPSIHHQDHLFTSIHILSFSHPPSHSHDGSGWCW